MPAGRCWRPSSCASACACPRRSVGSRTAWRSAWGCTPGRWWWARWRTSRSGPTPRRATPSPWPHGSGSGPAPDTLLVSAATYALVQDEVQGEACETLSLDGPSTPVPVIVASCTAGGRAHAAHALESLCGSHPGTGAAARAAGTGARRAGTGDRHRGGARSGQVGCLPNLCTACADGP